MNRYKNRILKPICVEKDLDCVIGRRRMKYTASSLWPCQKPSLKAYLCGKGFGLRYRLSAYDVYSLLPLALPKICKRSQCTASGLLSGTYSTTVRLRTRRLASAAPCECLQLGGLKRIGL